MNSKKYKLLLACTHSLGAKFYEGQLRFMREHGFDVYVVCAPGKEIETLCYNEGATFVPFPFKREIDLASDFKNLFTLLKLLKEINPDIVNTGTPKAGLLVTLAAKVAGIEPTIFTLRGLRSETLSGVKKIIVKGMEKLTCSLASIVVPISPSLSFHAQKIGVLNRKKSHVLGLGSSNGVNIMKFSPSLSDNEKYQKRKELNVSPDDFLISYVGRINNDKGVVELFSVFKQLALNNQKVKLLIVGRFEDEDAIPSTIKAEMEAHPSVILKGYTDDIKSIYEIIDVLVLYSKREGFGNILIEASSMQVPVIATNIPGCRDAVYHGVSGYLINSNQELYERLFNYFTNRETAKQDGLNGRKWVKKNFDSTLVWRKQLNLYNQLLKK